MDQCSNLSWVRVLLDVGRSARRAPAWRVPVATAVAALACVTPALADPSITQMSLRGLQLGATTRLVVEGKELLPNPVVLAPFSIASQAASASPGLAAGGTSQRVEFTITLDDRVIPGIYQIRLASDKGVSAPLAVAVDRLAQLPFAEQTPVLPVALHGAIQGTETLATRFRGRRGETFLADVEVQQLGARFKPLLRVKDARGRQLAWSSSRGPAGGDASLVVELPEDGEYSVELHDILYRASAPAFFRLKLGQFTGARLVFPLGVQMGSRTPLEYLGANIPSDVVAEFDARDLIRPTVLPAPAVPGALHAGGLPAVAISPHPEVVEIAPPGERQALSAPPVAVSGRIARKGEQDQYLLPVSAGARLHLEIFAQRWGSPLDSVLTVANESGGQLATGDDRPGMRDPGLDLTVPQDTRQLLVTVRDLAGRGGEDFVYRLEVSAAGTPDFTVQAEFDRVNIPAGATQSVRLNVARSGYDGPIRLDVQGLPPDVTLAGTEIPAGATIGLLSFTSSGSSPAHHLGRITARGEGDAPERIVLAPENSVAQRFPWLREDFAFAVTEPPPLAVAWSDLRETHLPLGTQLPLAIALRRQPGVTGAVRLRLLTTQVTPRKKVKENNQDKEVDDVERTLRLAAEATLAADAKDGTASIAVPADLADREWGIVLAADLLDGDNKSVVATSTTPLRTFRTVVPFSIELTSSPAVTARAGAGETGKLSGKITRRAGFVAPLNITLQGLPKEYAPPTVQVAPDKDTFELEVRFPEGAKPAELANVQLVAVHQPDPKQADLAVRSNAVTLQPLKVVAGDPPGPSQK